MQLKDLVAGLELEIIEGALDIPISGITQDSRQVKPNFLFVCIKGFKADGHSFIPQAIEKGASAILVEDLEAIIKQRGRNLTYLKAKSSRKALGLLAANFFNKPASKLNLIGITGTNGKTTVAHLLGRILDCAAAAGSKNQTAVIGTLGVKLNDSTIPIQHTTPEAHELQAILSILYNRGYKNVVMEASSHALALERLSGCSFRAAIFTNRTQDHLDFHQDMEKYLGAKRRLFTEYLASDGLSVVNLDCPYSRNLIAALSSQVITYGLKAQTSPQVSAAQIQKTNSQGTLIEFKTPKYRFKAFFALPGYFNIYNALAAVSCAVGLGVDKEAIITGLQTIESIPGRFEFVNIGQPFHVVIDYAHTPQALSAVLQAANQIVKNKLIVVFGCGGDRDKTKRPLMGKIATEYANLAIITSDNPRSEEPMEIIDAIVSGIKNNNYLIEPDRYLAIKLAIDNASEGDLVLIAGKGHENYQIFRDRVVEFSDRKVALELLSERYKRAH